MDEMPTLRVGDRVHHVDTPDRLGTITGFFGYPLAKVKWESTGRESTVNFHYLAHDVQADSGPPETITCPECGKQADRWEDPTGSGYQCVAPDCLTLIEN